MAESSKGEREREANGDSGMDTTRSSPSSSLFCPLQLNLAVASNADCKEREEAALTRKRRREGEDMLAVGGLAKLAVASRKGAIRTFYSSGAKTTKKGRKVEEPKSEGWESPGEFLLENRVGASKYHAP